MVERNEFDRELREVRMKMAMEKTEWFKYFKIRDKYIKITIVSFFVVWIILASFFIVIRFDSIYLFVIPNLFWIFLVAPVFSYKINHLTNIINSKKEELIIHLWKTKTQQIEEIIILTGIDKIFVEYYLTKNELLRNTSTVELNPLEK